MNKLYRPSLLAVGWFIFITILFFIPAPELPEKKWWKIPHLDKAVHFIFFAILVYLWRTVFYSKKEFFNYLLISSAVLYGLLIEILQGWLVPNRSFDIYDLVADTAGSVFGILAWSGIYKKNKPL